MAKGYNQDEGINYEDTYALVTHLEAIRPLLVLACCLDFKLYQMDVKSTFLNDYINEEDYISQPLGFEDHEKSYLCFKFKRALYGLKRAPRAFYERLSRFLFKQGFNYGKVYINFFIKRNAKYILLVKIYVDDIISDSTNESFCQEFASLV